MMQKRVDYHDTMENASAGLLTAIQASFAGNAVVTAFIGAEANVGAPHPILIISLNPGTC